jgi:hypothetical protein
MTTIVCVYDTLSLCFLKASHEGFVDIAPPPILPGLQRLYDGMPGLVEVLSGVLAGRRITTSDETTRQAQAQADPALPDLQTHFTTVGFGCYVLNLGDVLATHDESPESESADLNASMGMRTIKRVRPRSDWISMHALCPLDHRLSRLSSLNVMSGPKP